MIFMGCFTENKKKIYQWNKLHYITSIWSQYALYSALYSALYPVAYIGNYENFCEQKQEVWSANTHLWVYILAC